MASKQFVFLYFLENTFLLQQRPQTTGCLKDGCSFQNPPLLINAAIFSIVFELFGICIVLSRFSSDLMEKNFIVILVMLVLVIMLLGTGFFLSHQEMNNEELSFKVPFLPWLPMFALFSNIYLIYRAGSFNMD